MSTFAQALKKHKKPTQKKESLTNVDQLIEKLNKQIYKATGNRFRKYQIVAIKWIIKHPYAGLFLAPGVGKTLISLSAFYIRKQLGLVNFAFIIAPRRVCYRVWPQEIKKWGFKFSIGIMHGAKKEEVLNQQHDIYIINPEGLKWLLQKRRPAQLKKWLTNNVWLFVDESSMFRNSRSVRFKSLKKLLRYFSYRTILTGTPAPRGLEGLFGQLYILDLGARFGEYITHYRNQFFYPSGFGGYTYLPQEGAEKRIYKAIDDIILAFDRDVLDMPPLEPVLIEIELPSKIMRTYKDMEKEFLIEVEEKGFIAAATGAVASGKCRQIASGAIYDDRKKVTRLHDEKVEALKELVDELEGQPLMVFFEFNMEAEWLLETFPKARIIWGKTTDREQEEIEELWNAGNLELVFLQPAAGAWGLNLQAGGCRDICWVTPTWDAEKFEQAYSRVWRQGVAGGVRMHMIIAVGTIDTIVYEAVEKKENIQTALKKALTKKNL